MGPLNINIAKKKYSWSISPILKGNGFGEGHSIVCLNYECDHLIMQGGPIEKKRGKDVLRMKAETT